jgi:ABC-type multidrug transport system fused ATPase/permease subunit
MQDNSLFNTSIKNNLLYAKHNATYEEIINCLHKAKADFVFQQKD